MREFQKQWEQEYLRGTGVGVGIRVRIAAAAAALPEPYSSLMARRLRTSTTGS